MIKTEDFTYKQSGMKVTPSGGPGWSPSTNICIQEGHLLGKMNFLKAFSSGRAHQVAGRATIFDTSNHVKFKLKGLTL